MRFKHQSLRLSAIAAMLCAGLSSASAGTSTFDSVAEFSSTQGQGGWQYGFFSSPGSAGSFTAFTNYSAFWQNGWSEATSPAPWTTLWNTGGHPNGPNSVGGEHDAVRRWTSGATGTLTISGSYAIGDFGNTRLSVLVDGQEIWNGITASATQTFSVSSSVMAGSTVDFVINSNGVDFGDTTRFTVTGAVTAVPEPASATLLLAGAGLLAACARRRRA